ncbi:MAG: amidohydrolase [Deltaproteobacteria bacterium]|nr:amidohydrolase [Deltaproteobacteria bacterium]
MSLERYKAKFLFYQGRFQENLILEVSDGTILRAASKEHFKGQTVTDLGHVALLPGTVNTHNHSFQSLVRGFGDDMPFFDWRDQGIYKYSLSLKKEDIYTGALFAFGEMLKHGITTVCDFFYIQDNGNENAKAVIQAAKDLGIRLVLARCFYDWQTGPKRYQEKPKEARARCLELMKEYETDSMVTITPAPHSPHAASREMILAAFQVAQETNSMFHIHVAEARYEVENIQKETGLTPLLYLDRLGVVTNKMVMVHGVWLSDKEIALMASRGVKLSYNPSSNMFLGDGIAPIKKILDQKVTIALGTDGACSNNKTSLFEEMRMAALLQKVHCLDSSVITAEQVFQMGTENGGKVLGLPIGKLEAGYRADFVTVSLDNLELYPLQNLHKNVVYSFSPTTIDEVVVNGKKIFSKGQLLTISEEEIIEKVSQLTRHW